MTPAQVSKWIPEMMFPRVQTVKGSVEVVELGAGEENVFTAAEIVGTPARARGPRFEQLWCTRAIN